MTTMVANTFDWIGFSGIANWFRNLGAAIVRNRQINRTIKELSALSNRELNDIGIARGDIYWIAHETHTKNDNVESNRNLKGWV